MGKIINFKFLKNNQYLLQWGTKTKLKTFSDTLSCPGTPLRDPEYIAEGKKYLLMHSALGSGTWVGLFLPMDKNEKPQLIYNYEAYDLIHNLVVYFDYDKKNKPHIVIKNLKSLKKQTIAITEECKSANPSYCISITSIKNKVLSYSWDPNFSEGSKKIAEKKVKILI